MVAGFSLRGGGGRINLELMANPVCTQPSEARAKERAAGVRGLGTRQEEKSRGKGRKSEAVGVCGANELGLKEEWRQGLVVTGTEISDATDSCEIYLKSFISAAAPASPTQDKLPEILL